MNGLMMHYPLTIRHILEHASSLFADQEIASRFHDGIHRISYAEFHRRTNRLGHVLSQLGVGRGSRVGTLCWNSHRHLELYFAVPAYGAVLHTLNLRLSEDQLAYIVNHAQDEVIFCDASILPILNRIRDQIPCVRAIVALPDEPGHTEALDYEALLSAAPPDPYPWPDLDERVAAATCYTSGTTGNPKGVLYDHRSLFLHSMSIAMVDVFGFSERDTLMQVVPMFHANGWGMPYAALLTGMKIVLSGRHLQPEDIAYLIESERVTFSAGVPTLWMGLYSYLENNPRDISSLRTIVAAGSAMPRQFIEWFDRKYHVQFRLAWGMTETTPIATVTIPRPRHAALSDSEKYDLLARHGRVSAGLELRVIDDQKKPVTADGKTMGELQIRGAWITDGYFNDPRSPEDAATSFDTDERGHRWFRTGDVATIDADGYIQIMDRTKDLVKSGGEWISSVDLENLIMAHPQVAEAAVIAIPHPKWEERPLACVVRRDPSLTKEDIIEFLRPKVAKWWLPDEVVFIEAVPKTSVGKFNKRALRVQFESYGFGGAAS